MHLQNEAPHRNCNKMHLSSEGIKVQTGKKDESKKVLRPHNEETEDDGLQFVAKDHANLVEIVHATNTKDMTPAAKLWWENQIKQLSSKSANGHRWDPRYNEYRLGDA